jgi:hypothetical protein
MCDNDNTESSSKFKPYNNITLGFKVLPLSTRRPEISDEVEWQQKSVGKYKLMAQKRLHVHFFHVVVIG